MAQLVKNLPAVRETWVQSLVWEYPPEKTKASHPSILDWRIPWGCKESDMTEQLSLSDEPPLLPVFFAYLVFLLLLKTGHFK